MIHRDKPQKLGALSAVLVLSTVIGADAECIKALNLGNVTYDVPCEYIPVPAQKGPPYDVHLSYPGFSLPKEETPVSPLGGPFTAAHHPILNLRMSTDQGLSIQSMYNNASGGLPVRLAPKVANLVDGVEVGPSNAISRWYLTATKHSLLTCSQFSERMVGGSCNMQIEIDGGAKIEAFMAFDMASHALEIERGVVDFFGRLHRYVRRPPVAGERQ